MQALNLNNNATSDNLAKTKKKVWNIKLRLFPPLNEVKCRKQQHQITNPVLWAVP